MAIWIIPFVSLSGVLSISSSRVIFSWVKIPLPVSVCWNFEPQSCFQLFNFSATCRSSRRRACESTHMLGKSKSSALGINQICIHDLSDCTASRKERRTTVFWQCSYFSIAQCRFQCDWFHSLRLFVLMNSKRESDAVCTFASSLARNIIFRALPPILNLRVSWAWCEYQDIIFLPDTSFKLELSPCYLYTRSRYGRDFPVGVISQSSFFRFSPFSIFLCRESEKNADSEAISTITRSFKSGKGATLEFRIYSPRRVFSPFHAASSRPIILPIRGGCCSRGENSPKVMIALKWKVLEISIKIHTYLVRALTLEKRWIWFSPLFILASKRAIIMNSFSPWPTSPATINVGSRVRLLRLGARYLPLDALRISIPSP